MLDLPVSSNCASILAVRLAKPFVRQTFVHDLIARIANVPLSCPLFGAQEFRCRAATALPPASSNLCDYSGGHTVRDDKARVRLGDETTSCQSDKSAMHFVGSG